MRQSSCSATNNGQTLDTRLPGPVPAAGPSAGYRLLGRKFVGQNFLERVRKTSRVRKGRFSILRKISKKKIVWSIFVFVGGGFPAIWNHFKPPGKGFQPPGTVLVSFETVSGEFQPLRQTFHQLGKALASCQGFWPTCRSFCQWNSIGSNGIPLDPMEFHGIERTGAMTINDGRRSWLVIV